MTPSVETRQANEALGLVQSVWETIGAHLENARRQVQEEIRHYSPPIPACDADFNHLLEERARIGEELNRMQVAAGKSLSSTDSITLIEEFILSSNYMTDKAKHEIRSCLNEMRKMET